MSHKIIDQFHSRSTRTRRLRVEQGLCPDCGGMNKIVITRCMDCRIKRGIKRKERTAKNESYREVEWSEVGRDR